MRWRNARLWIRWEVRDQPYPLEGYRVAAVVKRSEHSVPAPALKMRCAMFLTQCLIEKIRPHRLPVCKLRRPGEPGSRQPHDRLHSIHWVKTV